MEERYVSISEVKNILKRIQKERKELTYEQKIALKHAEAFARLSVTKTKQLIKELLDNIEKIDERHRHRYEVNPEYIHTLESGGLVFSGWSSDKRRMEVLEIPGNRFFMATQFHPEFKSRPWKPSPVYYGFVKACLEKALNSKKLS